MDGNLWPTPMATPAPRGRGLSAVFLALGATALGGWGCGPAAHLAQEQAAAEVEDIGGVISWDERSSDGSIVRMSLNVVDVTDEDLAPLEHLSGLRFVDLSDTNISGPGLAFLREAVHVRELDLERTSLTDAGLAHLRDMAKLRGLYLGGTPVTDAGLAHLRELGSLETLSLGGTSVTDAGLAHLHVLVHLQTVNLSDTQVTPDGMDALQKALPQLEILHHTEDRPRLASAAE